MKSVLPVVFEGRARPKNNPLVSRNVLKVIPDFASVYGAAVWAVASEARDPVIKAENFMMADGDS